MKIAIIGAGYFAHFHLDAWKRMPGMNIAGIADLDIEKARAAADHYNTAAFQDPFELIEKVKPDVIDVITPPDTHLSLLDKLLPFAIPIIIQKPLAPDFKTALEIVTLCEHSETRVMIHENWRFQPWYRLAHQWINEGKLGTRIHQLSFNMRMGDGWPADAYLSRQPYFRTMTRLLIHETGIHFIDTFRYLLGDVASVYAKLQRLNDHIVGEDSAICLMNHHSGAISLLNANRYNESNKENPRYTFGNMLLEGSKGSLRLYEDGSLTFQSLGSSEQEIEYNPSKKGFAGDCVYNTQYHFISCLKSGAPFETNPEEYFKSLTIQEAIYNSNELNQVISVEKNGMI